MRLHEYKVHSSGARCARAGPVTDTHNVCHFIRRVHIVFSSHVRWLLMLFPAAYSAVYHCVCRIETPLSSGMLHIGNLQTQRQRRDRSHSMHPANNSAGPKKPSNKVKSIGIAAVG